MSDHLLDMVEALIRLEEAVKAMDPRMSIEGILLDDGYGGRLFDNRMSQSEVGVPVVDEQRPMRTLLGVPILFPQI